MKRKISTSPFAMGERKKWGFVRESVGLLRQNSLGKDSLEEVVFKLRLGKVREPIIGTDEGKYSRQ